MKFTEKDWRRLLRDIADRQVIPVIGPELLGVQVDTKRVNLYRYLAEQLMERLDIDEAGLPEQFGLGDVVDAYLKHDRNDPDDLYYEIRDVMDGSALAVPESLRKLAEISQFEVFITTTFDSLLEEALKAVRQNRPPSQVLAYCTKHPAPDLQFFDPEKETALFHFFGKINPEHDFAVTDEDVLKFAYRLQSKDHRPNDLFDLIRKKNLLTLGCGFPNWLTRFFLTAAKGDGLFTEGAKGVFVDDLSLRNASLVLFLERQKMNLYREGDAVAFVDELHDRWTKAYGAKTVETPQSPKPGFVFISFHSADRETAREVSKAFEAAGVEVWLDEADLDPGVAYESEIESNIENCAYFFPLLSRSSVSGERRFFQFEWKKAIREAQFRAEDYPYIQPIIIDETPPEHEGIPDYFKQRHCQWLKDLSELVALTIKRLREMRSRAA